VVGVARCARRVAWTAVAVVVLTGFYNLTGLGPLDRVMESGAGRLLAGKFVLVLLAVAIAGQRDFAQVPRLQATLRGGHDAAAILATITRLDRLVLVLAAIIVYLGLAASRAG
jgi:hypothetical protein